MPIDNEEKKDVPMVDIDTSGPDVDVDLPEEKKEYTIRFRFIVIDSYDQVYIFNVSIESMSSWMDDLFNALEAAKYHFDTKNFNLPYEFLVRRVNL